MARVLIRIVDEPDGGLKVEFFSDPRIDFDRPDKVTNAQHMGAACLETIRRESAEVDFTRAG